MSSFSSLSPDPNAPLGLIANTAPVDDAVALLTAAQAFIGNDSGLLNIAAACGRPTIGIFAQREPLDYTENIIPVVPQDGKFDEAGAIGRIMPEQAFSVLAATLLRQGAVGAEQPVT